MTDTFVPQAEGKAYAHKIRSAEFELEQAKSNYLRRWGWENTSNTPGSYWMWKRDFKDYDEAMERVYEERKLPSKFAPYGVVLAPTDLAVKMTLAALDEQLELGGGDE